MTFNSQEIIQDVRTEFERLLEFVTGEQARTAQADHIERGLFKMLLKLGAKLLQLFLPPSANRFKTSSKILIFFLEQGLPTFKSLFKT